MEILPTNNNNVAGVITVHVTEKYPSVQPYMTCVSSVLWPVYAREYTLIHNPHNLQSTIRLPQSSISFLRLDQFSCSTVAVSRRPLLHHFLLSLLFQL
jgi:hypothetical protein